MRTWLPIIVAGVLLIGLSGWEAVISDRFRGSGISEEEIKKRFDKIPMNLPGTSWVGEDKEVSQEILDVAGAVNHINRFYTNGDTGERVDVWLISGHSRDVCRHTPNICYISQGFRQRKSQVKHTIEVPGEEPAEFYTAVFSRESGDDRALRVFWAWNGNAPDLEQTAWIAPDNARRTFGNNTALYKLYFTVPHGPSGESPDDSLAVDFARLMLPIINESLFSDEERSEAADSASEGAIEAAGDPLAEVADE